MATTSQPVRAAPAAPPTDMKLASAPVANARPLFGNQFAMTPVQTGNSPAWKRPFATRATNSVKNPPMAVAAVARDHATAKAGSARLAPNRCPAHAPGIWHTAYEIKKALINQPDCTLVRPRSARTVLSATPMALRLTYASAAAPQSHASTAKRTTLGLAEDWLWGNCGSLISFPSITPFDHSSRTKEALTLCFSLSEPPYVGCYSD